MQRAMFRQAAKAVRWFVGVTFGGMLSTLLGIGLLLLYVKVAGLGPLGALKDVARRLHGT